VAGDDRDELCIEYR